MASLPNGFSARRVPDGIAVLRDDLADALLAAGVGRPDALPCSDAARGRAAHPIVELGGGRGRVVVRRCLHGGLWGRLTRGAFWGWSRAADELRVTVAARGRGAPVAEALGLVALRRGLGLWQPYVLSQEIAGAADLRTWLEAGHSPAERRAAACAAAHAVAACHNAGIVHADLHVKNVLVRWAHGSRPQAYVIDLDKARLRDRVAMHERLANLARLNRSVEKWPATRKGVTAQDKLWFLRAYEREAGPLPRAARRACGRVGIARRLAWQRL